MKERFGSSPSRCRMRDEDRDRYRGTQTHNYKSLNPKHTTVINPAHTPGPDDDPAEQLEQADAPAGRIPGPQLIQDWTVYCTWMCSRLELAKKQGYQNMSGK